MNSNEIIARLPYREPFLFVDEIESISENGIGGNYTFHAKSFFYKGHFKDKPVTPGVILTECMAQIGVVSLGIFLMKDFLNEKKHSLQIGLTATNIEFFHPVFPGEKVKVISEKVYFRFNKLKCKVKMYDESEKLCCKGEISGMLKH